MNATAHDTIWMIDSTLRDGEQSPGVSFSLTDKITIATMLSDAGIDEIEAGIPAMGMDECKDIFALTQLGLPCRITSWCRAHDKDLTLAAKAGVSSIHIGFPVSDIHLSVMGKTRESILDDMDRLVHRAHELFDVISLGAMDATRAHMDFLFQFIEAASSCGVERVRIADTVGLASPSSVSTLIRNLIRRVPGLTYEFHGHNDLGMATANALTAAESGARALSTTLNGLGERAGNAPTEEVAAAIRFTSSLACRVNPAKLPVACGYVAHVTGHPVHGKKPITGMEVFDHESGIHGHAHLKNPLSFQPFLPEDVGHEPSRLVLGSHSGTATLSYLLSQAGITLSRKQAGSLMTEVRRLAKAKGEAISADDLMMLYDTMAP